MSRKKQSPSNKDLDALAGDTPLCDGMPPPPLLELPGLDPKHIAMMSTKLETHQLHIAALNADIIELRKTVDRLAQTVAKLRSYTPGA